MNPEREPAGEAQASGRRLGPLAGLVGLAQRNLRAALVPLGEVVRAIPAGARLLDVGCGEGLVLTKALDRAGEVVGIDLDARKLAVARARLRGASHVELLQEEAFAFLARQSAGAFDTVLLVDTLSGFPVGDQDRLLLELVRVLAPGGTLVLKIMDALPEWKASLSRALSGAVYALKMTLSPGQRFTYRSSTELATLLTAAGLEVRIRRLHEERWHPLPHTLLLARRPGAGPARAPSPGGPRSGA